MRNPDTTKKLLLAERALCRTPVFPVDATLDTVWPYLQAFIREASPAFYENIRDVQAGGLDTLPEKTRFSIWKYFNRAKYRATPFGQFATVSLVPLMKGGGPVSQLALRQQPIIHRFVDWGEANHSLTEPRILLRDATTLMANPTLYLCSNGWRYLGEENETFVLKNIESDELLSGILHLCKRVSQKTDVMTVLKKQYALTWEETIDCLATLIDLQLLFTDRHPNITGRDYFRRTGKMYLSGKQGYIISERKWVSGAVADRTFDTLREAVHFLHGTFPKMNMMDLEAFKERFLHRFEYRQVPLMEALDPETGVGYGGLEHAIDHIPLLTTLQNPDDRVPYGDFSPIYRFIINKAVAQQPIRLEEMESNGLRTKEPLPNSFSAVVRFAHDEIVAEQLGGCTAAALLGRFSLAMDDVADFTKTLAKQEAQANPQVLFFDVAYRGDKQADNINRREHLYDYELPILCWSTHPRILRLNDLYVSVVGGEAVLHSKEYGRRVIPRLVSAYNYNRSDLAVFRFLSDVQQQGIRADLSLRLPLALPGLDHYPRVQYKNVVLSPAKWRIPKRFSSSGNTIDDFIPDLKEWLHTIGLGKWCRCGQADQFLYFDTASDGDMRMLLLHCNRQPGVYVEEALMDDHAGVKDEHGKSYLSEFVVSFTHQQAIYEENNTGRMAAYDVENNNTPALYMQGEEWLYTEIYCHPARIDALLLNIVLPFITAYRNAFREWFYIRYYDPNPHVRIRFRLRDKNEGLYFIQELSKKLKPDMQSGLISDFILKPYRPEWERYGRKNMYPVERCFTRSSDLAMRLLEQRLSEGQLYASVIGMLGDVMEQLGWILEERYLFAKRLADSLALEMNFQKESFKALNQQFKDWHYHYQEVMSSQDFEHYYLLTFRSFSFALRRCKEEEKPALLTDLFHMHINRLFSHDQRLHECIIYQYVTLLLRIKKATG